MLQQAANVAKAAVHLRGKITHPERRLVTKAHTLQAILNKKPEQRTAEEVDLVFEWVTKNENTNKLFSGIQDVICKSICREMTLYNAPPGTVVCYQGDFGDIFYIILAGQVSLYVDSTENRTPMEEEMRNNTIDYNDEHTRKSFGIFIRKIGAGGTFGELAVLDPSAQRTCTVVTNVQTSFICLKRAAYHRLIRACNGEEITFTQFEFVEDLYYFESWAHGDIQRLSNKLKPLTISADSFLLRHGNEVNSMFLIYSGIVQESTPMISLTDEYGFVVKYTQVEEVSTKKPKIVAPEESVMQGVQLGDLHRKRISLETAVYEEHDICGEHALLFNEAHSKVDLRAVTDVKVLVMDRATWNDVFMIDRLEHILHAQQLFRDMAIARDNWRNTRIAIASTHPRLLLTISTRSMMKHAKTICGWCGSHDHITGDRSCTKVVEAKFQAGIRKQRKKQAEEQRIMAINGTRMAKKKSILNQKFKLAAQTVITTTHLRQRQSELLSPKEQLYRDWQIAATKQKIIANHEGTSPKLQVPQALRTAIAHPKPPEAKSPKNNFSPRHNFHILEDETRQALPTLHLPHHLLNTLAKDNVAIEYKQNLLQQLKKVQSITEYQEKRVDVLKSLEQPAQPSPTTRPRVPRNKKWRRENMAKRTCFTQD
ncbi:hypothetical protein THRCLA_21932 [Thraustotheca clavata]|uniref:Cyclic nucleotide-binding domain-containing protein n=1 Tax=Thraustotheca clavata TaxID=74557 RepID=A0A1V9ZHH5_9STRA|nr:hypothetical protein THRCLA_21932 [Thraustotheca clavata]